MPSRRRLLAGVSALGASAVAGCADAYGSGLTPVPDELRATRAHPRRSPTVPASPWFRRGFERRSPRRSAPASGSASLGGPGLETASEELRRLVTDSDLVAFEEHYRLSVRGTD